MPAGSGTVSATPEGKVGFIDFGWLLSQYSQLTSVYSPTSFLIILVNDVYITTGGSCCTLGFHFLFQPSPGLPPPRSHGRRTSRPPPSMTAPSTMSTR